MPLTLLLVTAAFAGPALVLGAAKVYLPLRWHQRRKRLPWREVIDRMVVMAVRFGVLLLLLLAALVAILGSLATMRSEFSLPDGVVIAGIGAILLSILTIATFGRPRRWRR